MTLRQVPADTHMQGVSRAKPVGRLNPGSGMATRGLPAVVRPPSMDWAGQATAPVALIVFFATLPLLFSFYIAGVRLSPVRLYLLVSFLPALLALFSGRAGRVLAADVVMAGFGLWIVVSLIVDDGMSQLPNSVMTAIELYGGYLLGRVLIRTPEDFRLMIRAYLGLLVFLLPFALTEFLTGRLVLHEIFAHLGQTVWKPESSYDRAGFARTMSGFEHPILYGLFCSSLASTIFYAYRGAGRVIRLGLVGMMTFLSLSSAPLLSLFIQIGLVLWDKITRGRWVVLMLLSAAAYLTVDLFANRAPLIIIISYLTFDPWTAWTRIAQWNYSTVAVMDHPIFGLGMGNAWQSLYKPGWLTDSVDSFWLVIAIRHGLVGVALVIAAIVLLLINIGRPRLFPGMLRDYRTGYMIGVVGLCFVLVTVHIWGAASIFAFFFLGAGAWLTEAKNFEETAGEAPAHPIGAVSRPALPETLPLGKPRAGLDREGKTQPTTRFAQNHVRTGGGARPETPPKPEASITHRPPHRSLGRRDRETPS